MCVYTYGYSFFMHISIYIYVDMYMYMSPVPWRGPGRGSQDARRGPADDGLRVRGLSSGPPRWKEILLVPSPYY